MKVGDFLILLSSSLSPLALKERQSQKAAENRFTNGQSLLALHELNELLTPRSDLSSILAYNKKARRILLFGATKLGGILGHLSALKLVQTQKLEFDSIYGCHTGSITAAMLKRGVSYKRLLHFILKELRSTTIYDFRVADFIKSTLRLKPLDLNGVCYGRELRAGLGRLFENSSDATDANLFIGAEHLRKNSISLFSPKDTLTLLQQLRAAMAVTPIYAPVRINNELYIDSGSFSSLPLTHIYENERRITRKRKLPLLIIAFQEGFSKEQPQLSLLDRLNYSFTEKIRYNSTLIELSRAKNQPIQLVLISFHSKMKPEKSLVNMNKEDKWLLLRRVEKQIAEQLHYYANLEPHNKAWPIYSITD